MPSSSSSEDEDFSKFKEAADSVLYHDSLYENGNSGTSKQVEVIPAAQVSLRNIDGDVEANIHQELNVTPAFQKHVAKHLSKLLDSQLEISEKSELKKDKLETSRCILKAKRKKTSDGPGIQNEGGVRLLRQSADFLSNLDIVPLYHQMKQIGRKGASYTSESSSDESDDSNNMQKLSDAAVSSDWLLSGAATKGWAIREDRIEKCRVNESGIIIPIENGFEMLNEVSCSNPRKVFNVGIKDDKVSQRSLKRKSSMIDSELAASFSSVVRIGTDSQEDSCRKSKNKVKKKKRRKKEQHSEDATTETTEVEDLVEKERKVKKSKKKKKPKHLRKEEKRREEVQMLNNCVPGLLCEGEELPSKRKEKRKKKHKETKLSRHSFLKEKRIRSFKKTSKKKLKKKLLHLPEDLAKLMVTSKGNLDD